MRKKARKFFLVIERKSVKGNINNKYSVRLIQKVLNFLLSIKRSQFFGIIRWRKIASCHSFFGVWV